MLKTYELSKVSAQRSRRWSNRKVNRRARTRACVHIDTPWHILRRFEECCCLEEEIEKMEDAIDGVRNHKTLWVRVLDNKPNGECHPGKWHRVASIGGGFLKKIGRRVSQCAVPWYFTMVNGRGERRLRGLLMAEAMLACIQLAEALRACRCRGRL